jgi:hypothetical protein
MFLFPFKSSIEDIQVTFYKVTQLASVTARALLSLMFIIHHFSGLIPKDMLMADFSRHEGLFGGSAT